MNLFEWVKPRLGKAKPKETAHPKVSQIHFEPELMPAENQVAEPVESAHPSEVAEYRGAVVQETQGSLETPDGNSLIRLALERGLPIEVLRELKAMADEERARKAKEVFDRQFSLMQAELPAAKKDKEVRNPKNNNKLMYTYCPLENMTIPCGPIINRYGFSYRWREQPADGGKNIIMTISGHGHSEEVPYFVPTVPATEWQNAAQVMGTLTSYGQRMSFKIGFGITIEGEDEEEPMLDKEKRKATRHMDRWFESFNRFASADQQVPNGEKWDITPDKDKPDLFKSLKADIFNQLIASRSKPEQDALFTRFVNLTTNGASLQEQLKLFEEASK